VNRVTRDFHCWVYKLMFLWRWE